MGQSLDVSVTVGLNDDHRPVWHAWAKDDAGNIVASGFGFTIDEAHSALGENLREQAGHPTVGKVE